MAATLSCSLLLAVVRLCVATDSVYNDDLASYVTVCTYMFADNAEGGRDTYWNKTLMMTTISATGLATTKNRGSYS